MPRSSPLLLTLACLLLAPLAATSAQTLARPGLAGSGLNADPWWQHAVFYRIAGPGESASESRAPTPGPDPDFKAIAGSLDALQSLSIDALILPMPSLPLSAPAHGMDTASAHPSAAPGSALDDFDSLVHEASRRGIRILLDFTASSVTPDLSALAQFWLSRGVAGFHLVTPPETGPADAQAIAQALRKVADAAVGQRIVISSYLPEPTPHPPTAARSIPRTSPPAHASRTANPAAAQLQIDSRLNHLEFPGAADLRTLLNLTVGQSPTQPNLLLDFHPPHPASDSGSPDPYPSLARAIAAILLTTHPAALIDADPRTALTAPPAETAALAAAGSESASLAEWYRQLSALHHGNPVLRYGSVTMLDFDRQNALVWVRRTTSGSRRTPPLVVACNLSASPVTLSIRTAIEGLNLRGSFLRILLRTDQAIGPQDLNSVQLPPFAVYIGELGR